MTPWSAKNSLKFKAKVKDNLVSVRVGNRRFVVPVQSRTLADEQYAYISFHAISELFKIEDGKLTAISDPAEAFEAHKSLNKSTKKKQVRGKRTVEMSTEILDLLKKIPSGHKLVPNPKGGYRLVRTRKRS